jgi:hypothetical protein
MTEPDQPIVPGTPPQGVAAICPHVSALLLLVDAVKAVAEACGEVADGLKSAVDGRGEP